MKNPIIIKGFPQDNSSVIPFGNQPFYSEGFIVRFFKKDGSSWVGNFRVGGTELFGIYNLTNENEILVLAHGECYLIDIENQKLIKEIGGQYDSLIKDSENSFILSNGINVTIINPAGEVWNSGRISWDGIKNLKLDIDTLSGLSYDPMNKNKEWIPFFLNLKTKELKGGSYRQYEFKPISDNVSGVKKKPWWKNFF